MGYFNKKFKKPFSKKQRNEDGTEKLIYAVGDVHGRHDLLINVMSLIEQDIEKQKMSDPEIRGVIVIFLGDYIDRGHQSKDVLETLCHAKIAGAELFYLKGNHEAAALDFIEDAEDGKKWLEFGGRETLASYGVDIPRDIEGSGKLEKARQSFLKSLPVHHLSFLSSLSSYKIERGYMFVHAGVDPHKPIENQTDNEYLWIRDAFLRSMKKLPFIIVHGHTPAKHPVWDGRRIGIDTGAYLSNRLTAVRLFNGKVDFLST